MRITVDPRPAPVVNHDQLEVEAEGLGRYTIDVSLPLGYGATDASYPLVVVLDGNLLFDKVHVEVNGRCSIAFPARLRRSRWCSTISKP